MASFTFTVPDAKLADFKAGWLKVYPNNELDELGNPYTDDQWLKISARRELLAVYRQGKRELAEEAASPVIDEDVITDD